MTLRTANNWQQVILDDIDIVGEKTGDIQKSSNL